MYNLFKKFYTDNRRLFLWTAAIFLAVQSFVSIVYRGYDPEAKFVMTMAVYTAWLVCMAMLNMRAYYDRKTAVTAMLLPVSQWRKYLFAWVNSLVAGTAVFAVLYCVSNVVAMPFPLDEQVGQFADSPDYYNAVYPLMIYSAAMFICSFSVGAPYKWYSVATAGLLALAFFVPFAMQLLVLDRIIGPDDGFRQWIFIDSANMYTSLSYHLWGDNTTFIVILRIFGSHAFNAVFCAVWSAVMFAAGYFKFTERQFK